jgi:pimeloyl-ACP methyl ester carboxylesterase
MQLHCKTYGDGHPLIILHGLFGSLNNWNTLSRKFGGHFKVYALDQRNHGRSPHSDVFNYQVMAEDLKEFMEHHGIPTAHVLGHSMGGKTAMCFAVSYPENVDRLIVVDIAPKAYDAKHDEMLEAMSSLHLDEFSTRKEVDEALSTKVQDTVVRQFLLTNLARNDSGMFIWKLNLNGIRKNYREMNKGLDPERGFTNPTLFVAGGKSTYIRREDHSLIKKIFPHATITTISGAGHWVHAEAPGEFARVVLDFLQE